MEITSKSYLSQQSRLLCGLLRSRRGAAHFFVKRAGVVQPSLLHREYRPFTTVKGRFIEWGKIAVQIVQAVQEIVSEETAISTVPSTETLPVPKGRIRLSPCRMGSPLMVPLPDRTFTMAKGSSIQNS